MSMHLKDYEIEFIVKKSPKNLAVQQYLHFEKCEYCKNLYLQQLDIHNKLGLLKPIKTPAELTEQVIKTISDLSLPIVIKKQTDWSFLLAMIILFSIGSYFLFSGKLQPYLETYLPGNTIEKQQIIEEPSIFDSISNSLTKISFNFMPELKWHTLYIIFGLIATIVYIVLDRKLTRIYKLRRS